MGMGKRKEMNRLRQLRTERGLTQEKLGELIGTTGATVQRLESGNRQLTEVWIKRLCKALKIEVADIFGPVDLDKAPSRKPSCVATIHHTHLAGFLVSLNEKGARTTVRPAKEPDHYQVEIE
jgi:transcriptional regulator with XRE-family HTH domain